MKTAMRQVAGKVTGVMREIHQAQQLTAVWRTSMDRYVEHPGAAPDTYDEFLLRTSGVLLHEPSARRRQQRARRS